MGAYNNGSNLTKAGLSYRRSNMLVYCETSHGVMLYATHAGETNPDRLRGVAAAYDNVRDQFARDYGRTARIEAMRVAHAEDVADIRDRGGYVPVEA